MMKSLPSSVVMLPVNPSSSNGCGGSDPPLLACSEMSDYERRRAENIERNNARLRALGLISEEEESRSNAMAWRRKFIPVKKLHGNNGRTAGNDESTFDENADISGTNSRKRTRIAGSQQQQQQQLPSRKSLRLRGQQPDGQTKLHWDEDDDNNNADGSSNRDTKQNKGNGDGDDPEMSLRHERLAWVHECRLVRQRIALEAGSGEGAAERAAQENSTATYAHCLMRVRTMTDKGLANRVKAIERAAGRHCVIKMVRRCGKRQQRHIRYNPWLFAKYFAHSLHNCVPHEVPHFVADLLYCMNNIRPHGKAIFKSCLQDEDQWELAELASKALERLKALQPPPERE